MAQNTENDMQAPSEAAPVLPAPTGQGDGEESLQAEIQRSDIKPAEDIASAAVDVTMSSGSVHLVPPTEASAQSDFPPLPPAHANGAPEQAAARDTTEHGAQVDDVPMYDGSTATSAEKTEMSAAPTNDYVTPANAEDTGAVATEGTLGEDMSSSPSAMPPQEAVQNNNVEDTAAPVQSDAQTNGDSAPPNDASDFPVAEKPTSDTASHVQDTVSAASDAVHAADRAPDDSSAVRRADSDIEEGEELSSPPRASHNEDDISRRSQSRLRTPSPTMTRQTRSRDGRSRSPARERRGSPVRDGQKTTYNREELFKVYIGGLPEKTELADLQDCFGQFGEIGHIELKLGYAFIEFVTQEGAAEAIETYNEGQFLGKMIKVEASKSATTQQKSIDEGTCFTCGQHGHFAKYCPQDPRNAHRTRRAPPRERSPGRDRRDFRDREDRRYPPRDRDGPRRGDRDFDRDDSRRYTPRDRDDRRGPDRRRDRDDFNRNNGSGSADRYVEPHTRDSHRSISRVVDPIAAREREMLDQQRDKERQMRRMAEMDPSFVPPPSMPVAGYPPRGSTDGSAYPPAGLPAHAGSPYHPPYGSPAFPPPGGPLGGPPMYGMPPSMPGQSASPPSGAPYPPRGGDSRMVYNAPLPYPSGAPPYGRDGPGASDPYSRDRPYDRQDGFNGSDKYNSASRQPYHPPTDGSYPRGGDDRRPPDANLSVGAPPPPFYYDRPGQGWGGLAPGSERRGAGSPPFDGYGRPVPQSYNPSNGSGHEYDSYRPGR